MCELMHSMCTYDNESRNVSYHCLFIRFLMVNFSCILNIVLGCSLSAVYFVFFKASCMLVSHLTVTLLTVVGM